MLKSIDEVAGLSDEDLQRHITIATRHLKLSGAGCALSTAGVVLLLFSEIGAVEYVASGLVIGTVSVFMMYCLSELRIMRYEASRRKDAQRPDLVPRGATDSAAGVSVKKTIEQGVQLGSS